jgi:hypothetical protein
MIPPQVALTREVPPRAKRPTRRRARFAFETRQSAI